MSKRRKKSKSQTRTRNKSARGKASAPKSAAQTKSPQKKAASKKASELEKTQPKEKLEFCETVADTELETQTDSATLTMEKQSSCQEPSQKSDDTSAEFDSVKILEQLEFLVALHDGNQNCISEKSAQPADNTEMKELIEQNDKRFEKLEKQLENIAGQLSNGVSESGMVSEGSVGQLFDLYNTHFETQQTKLDQLSVNLESQSSSDSDPSDLLGSFDERLDSINSGIEKLTTILLGQQQLLESQGTRIDELSELGNNTEASQLLTDNGPELAESDEESASRWNQQKAAMLSKYGIDPEHRPSMELPSSEQPSEVALADELSTDAVATIEVPTNNLDPDDALAIENLKEQLNTKLREAEVELSIKRAKLSQFNAELDEKRVELDRRENALRDQQANGPNEPKKKMGMLERLKRHLTDKERKNLDRM